MSWELEIVDGVAVISMNSNAMNIMNNQFFKDLNGTLDEIEASHGNKPVVLTSSANAFSAGLDINEVLPLFSSKNKDAIKLWYENFKNSILRVFSFERPMIAAVNGHAIAGGLILAMCCDYRFVVDDNSKFGLNEISIGFPLPGSIAEIIKHVLGERNTERVIFSGLLYNCEDALKLGFFHDIVQQDDLVNISIDYAKQYNNSIFNAYVFSKKAIRNEVIKKINDIPPEIDSEMVSLLSSDETLITLQKLMDTLKK